MKTPTNWSYGEKLSVSSLFINNTLRLIEPLPIALEFISFALLLKKLKRMKQIAVILLIALSATANAQESKMIIFAL